MNGGSASGGSSTSEHKLAVKVLRLGKPHFQPRSAFDVPGIYTKELMLPRTIGPCFAGEHFNCLLSVVARAAIANAHLKIELQDSRGDVIELLDKSGVEFNPETPVTEQLEQELEFPGPRSLSVAIKYRDGEHTKTLSKTFTFEVSSALNIRTRILEIKPESGLPSKYTHAIEAIVENITDSVLRISECQVKAKGAAVVQASSDAQILKPRDIYSFSNLIEWGDTGSGHVKVDWTRDPLGIKGGVRVPFKL